MPKSSSERPAPASRRLRRVIAARSGSRMMSLSVISSFSEYLGRPVSLIRASTSSTRSGRSRSPVERLTEQVRSAAAWWRSRHSANCKAEARIISLPRSTIRPISPHSGRNSSGGTIPRRG